MLEERQSPEKRPARLRKISLPLLSILSLAVLAPLIAGCTARTETGYEPHKLGMSDAQIKGLYAPPFSPEAVDAGIHHQGDAEAPQPNTHPGGQ